MICSLIFADPPTKLNITTRPVKPKADEPLTVICSSDASNPESQLSWWKDGIQVSRGKHHTHFCHDAMQPSNMLTLKGCCNPDGSA